MFIGGLLLFPFFETSGLNLRKISVVRCRPVLDSGAAKVTGFVQTKLYSRVHTFLDLSDHDVKTKDYSELHVSRRKSMQYFLCVSVASLFQFQQRPIANAAVTDETISFASPSMDESYKQQSTWSPTFSQEAFTRTPSALPLSDEITFTVTKSDLQKMQGGLGLELGEVSFRTNFRVVIKSVAPNSLAEQLGIQPSWIVVSVNGADAERTNAAGVAIYFSRAVKSVLNSPDESKARENINNEPFLTLTFRDPARFRNELQNFPSGNRVA